MPRKRKFCPYPAPRRYKLHVAVVTHKHGANMYVATSEAALYLRLWLEFVFKYWRTRKAALGRRPPLRYDAESKDLVQRYFSDNDEEGLTIGEDEVTLGS